MSRVLNNFLLHHIQGKNWKSRTMTIFLTVNNFKKLSKSITEARTLQLKIKVKKKIKLNAGIFFLYYSWKHCLSHKVLYSEWQINLELYLKALNCYTSHRIHPYNILRITKWIRKETEPKSTHEKLLIALI